MQMGTIVSNFKTPPLAVLELRTNENNSKKQKNKNTDNHNV